MTKKTKEILVTLILIIVTAVLLCCNVFLVETTKAEVERIMGQLAKIEEIKEETKEKKMELLKQQKEAEYVEIIEFDEKYGEIKDDFLKKVKEASGKANGIFINIEELKGLVSQRLDISKEFKEKLSKLDNIPRPLKNFYEFEIEFLNNDIKSFTLVYDYYSSCCSTHSYSDDELKKVYGNNSELFFRAEEERIRVYKEYGLEYLLEDSF